MKLGQLRNHTICVHEDKYEALKVDAISSAVEPSSSAVETTSSTVEPNSSAVTDDKALTVAIASIESEEIVKTTTEIQFMLDGDLVEDL